MGDKYYRSVVLTTNWSAADDDTYPLWTESSISTQKLAISYGDERGSENIVINGANNGKGQNES